MTESLSTVAYLIAGVLFILSLSGLSTQQTARRGNLYGMIGMLAALVVTTASNAERMNYGVLAISVGVGGLIGALLALVGSIAFRSGLVLPAPHLLFTLLHHLAVAVRHVVCIRLAAHLAAAVVVGHCCCRCLVLVFALHQFRADRRYRRRNRCSAI